jgi:hypothetical protein
MRVQPVSGGDLDVLLGEVAGVRAQRRALGQLGLDRFQILRELLERRLELTRIRRLI